MAPKTASMLLTHLAHLLCMLCGLASVGGDLVMITTNMNISVVKSDEKLGPEYTMIKKISSISIGCQLKNSKQLVEPMITWKKQGHADSDSMVTEHVSSDSLRFESSLTVKYPRNSDVSSYTCTGKSGDKTATATAAFQSMPLLDIDVRGEGYSVQKVEGMLHPDLMVQPGVALTVICVVSGYPVGSANWFREDVNGVEMPTGSGSKLELRNPSYEKDRGHYVCRSANKFGSNSMRIFLRVTNPNAYLVPMIILIIEIVIVSVIYVIYELSLWEKRQRAERAALENFRHTSVHL